MQECKMHMLIHVETKWSITNLEANMDRQKF